MQHPDLHKHMYTEVKTHIAFTGINTSFPFSLCVHVSVHVSVYVCVVRHYSCSFK